MKTSPGFMRSNTINLYPLLFLGFFVLSCAPRINYYPQLNQSLLNQDYDAALHLVKESKASFAERNAVLYYLDEGILAHFASRYEESNQSLSKAESIMDELYTKSLSREAAAFIISDNTVPYKGEDFEAALVNLFMALNYVGLGHWEDALVEARKVDNKLNVFNAQHEEDERNVYREDAFIRFLMGVLYEGDREMNDAFISYRKAEDIYRNDYFPNYGVSAPGFLIENLLASAQAMGFEEEISEVRQKYPGVALRSPTQKMEMSEVYFIHYNGLAPEKVEEYYPVPMPDGYIAKIAYPKFEKKGYRISGSKISLQGLGSGRSYVAPTLLMEDIASIAVMNLDNRINRIKVKAIARATTKYLLAKEAENAAEREGGGLLGLIVKATAQAAAWATEQADIRHWRLLPAEVRVGRMLVPAGEYNGEIGFMDAGGTILSSTHIPSFAVTKGQKKFLMFRTIH
jgi:hypothetical protein